MCSGGRRTVVVGVGWVQSVQGAEQVPMQGNSDALQMLSSTNHVNEDGVLGSSLAQGVIPPTWPGCPHQLQETLGQFCQGPNAWPYHLSPGSGNCVADTQGPCALEGWKFTSACSAYLQHARQFEWKLFCPTLCFMLEVMVSGPPEALHCRCSVYLAMP